MVIVKVESNRCKTIPPPARALSLLWSFAYNNILAIKSTPSSVYDLIDIDTQIFVDPVCTVLTSHNGADSKAR